MEKKYYTVSYQHSESVYCSNIAHAESMEAVEAHYSKYSWCSVSECEPWELESAQRRGMPVVEIETAQPEEPARIAEKLENARQDLEARTDNSAWKRGVNVYALELLENLATAAADGYVTAEQLTTRSGIREALKNGAPSWPAYSSGGCSLIYDGDIAARLCTPSELKRTRDGERNPNSRETWLDVQARALSQAAARVVNAVMGG